MNISCMPFMVKSIPRCFSIPILETDPSQVMATITTPVSSIFSKYFFIIFALAIAFKPDINAYPTEYFQEAFSALQ